MKIIKLTLILTVISFIVVISIACTIKKDIKDTKEENDSLVEKPIEDDISIEEGIDSEEQETPVIIENNNVNDTIETPVANDKLDKEPKDSTLAETDPKKIIEAISEQVIEVLSVMDAAAISEYVHPVKGLRFTPYTFVSTESDLIFAKVEMIDLFDDPDEYLWGYYDGIGDEIRLTPSQYYSKFVYSEDFKNAPEIGYNEILSFGNSLENQFDIYDSSIIVEYYFPGFNEEYEGMDWQSLRLVFEEYDDSWKLVGIIHNQWTI